MKDVAQANAKQLQERLSLEEFGKVLAAEFAQQIEKIRYASYTLERAWCKAAMRANASPTPIFYVLVTDAYVPGVAWSAP